MNIQRILVPVDFSEPSMGALDEAIDLGKKFKAEIIALFVVEPVYYATPADLYGPSANLSLLLEDQQRYGKEQLAKLGKRLAKRGVKLRTLLQTGVPFQAISETATRVKASLIVMATHGRTGLAHVLLGSVTERVIRSATCPVLTLRMTAKPRRKPAKARSGE